MKNKTWSEEELAKLLNKGVNKRLAMSVLVENTLESEASAETPDSRLEEKDGGADAIDGDSGND